MPPPLAVNNLSMSPDGSLIAVATHDRILIWQIGDNAMPRASWVPQPGWQSPSSGTDAEDAIPCLGWDSEGQRLVYGLENKVCDSDAWDLLTADASSLPLSLCGNTILDASKAIEIETPAAAGPRIQTVKDRYRASLGCCSRPRSRFCARGGLKQLRRQ
jgi:hypothetical protein